MNYFLGLAKGVSLEINFKNWLGKKNTHRNIETLYVCTKSGTLLEIEEKDKKTIIIPCAYYSKPSFEN